MIASRSQAGGSGRLVTSINVHRSSASVTENAWLAFGRRLAGDLRKIREQRGISLHDLHAETMILRSLLLAFEETALFDYPRFDRVYLRSLVRQYAHVIGISPEMALVSLDEALGANYQGRLAVAYLEAETPAPETLTDNQMWRSRNEA